ncbi:MAG: hypothetical protein KatS3mg026_1693 [Bacteroidia bacterium]|nr:MAG: hypothetical protein KatS3mg026_1693 [Bacteroidia bacterium]
MGKAIPHNHRVAQGCNQRPCAFLVNANILHAARRLQRGLRPHQAHSWPTHAYFILTFA